MNNFELKRKMGDFVVTQRTNDCMFCASALLKQWNQVHPDKVKKLKDFMRNGSTVEFIKTIRERMWEERTGSQLIDNQTGIFLPANNQSVTNALLPNIPCMVSEDEVVFKKKGRQIGAATTGDEVWMHPMLFIDFAMWLNPRFKYDVIKFVHDHLVEYRVKVASMNRHWTDVLQGLGCTASNDYANMTDLLNMAVFGHTEREIRDSAVDTQLEKMIRLVDKYKFAYDNGWLATLEQLRELLENEYNANFGERV